jgi:hypothetical protein
MTFGIRRFTVGEPIEIQRRRRQGNGVDITWEKATFDHYKNGQAVVQLADGTMETITDGSQLR